MNKMLKKLQTPVTVLACALTLGSPFYKAHAKNDTLKLEIGGQKQEIIVDEKITAAAKEGLNKLLNSVQTDSAPNPKTEQKNETQSMPPDAQPKEQAPTAPPKEERKSQTQEQSDSNGIIRIIVDIGCIGLGLGVIGFAVWGVISYFKEKNESEKYKEY